MRQECLAVTHYVDISSTVVEDFSNKISDMDIA